MSFFLSWGVDIHKEGERGARQAVQVGRCCEKETNRKDRRKKEIKENIYLSI